ncbi:cysteine desulfurase family protein [Sphingobacterium sp. HJSM2_6]|uniref:cysteine desulfurase family protein n=1 Tax=Sphingobacterium sp. HJSM2_6 TaxID=3366264 RepID=UPI003BD0D474
MGFIYLDNNATTRVDNQVLESMLPYLQDQYGNASSVQHRLGRQANQAIEVARNQVASYLNVHPKEIFFNSGASEAIHTVIKGVFKAYARKGNHIITCKTEHKAVLSTCEAIEREGAQVTYLAVDQAGQIDLNDLKNSIREDTILVSLMAANNETGVIFPIQEIANICVAHNVLFFCDSTQWIGKLPLNLKEVPIDILCFSAHKFHGPKGIGGLFIRRKTKPIQIPALISGGNQEQGFRAGTYATHEIVGLGKAISLALNNEKIEALRNYFEMQAKLHWEEISIHSESSLRIPNTSNIHIKYVRANELMTQVSNMALASGSACVTGSRDPSHVLKAMKLSDEEAFCSIRFSFSKYNTLSEIDEVILQIKEAITSIRQKSPIWELYKEGLI